MCWPDRACSRHPAGVQPRFAAAWKESLDAGVGEGAAQRATETVAPWESHFSSPQNLKAALIDAGFSGVRVEVHPLSIGQSVDEYLADR